MKLSSLKPNEKKANEGVWVEWQSGIMLLIAKTGNQRYRDFVRAKMQTGGPKKLRTSALDILEDERMQGIVREGVARFVLLDWKDVQDDDGNELPYTWEEGVRAFDEFPELLEDVLGFANKSQNFRDEEIEDAAGNSETGSDGDSA